MNRGKEFWQEVRRAYENGEGSYRTLARRFAVSRSTVEAHGKNEGWGKGGQASLPAAYLQAAAWKLSGAAMRAVDRLEEGEMDVKTIRDLTALVKELNQLMKNAGEDAGESLVRVQWSEEAQAWSE